MRTLTISLALGVFSIAAAAQAPSRPPAPAKPAAKPAGSLAQVMRGIFFPNSNIIFDVQQNDPGAAKKKPEGGASATDTGCSVREVPRVWSWRPVRASRTIIWPRSPSTSRPLSSQVRK